MRKYFKANSVRWIQRIGVRKARYDNAIWRENKIWIYCCYLLLYRQRNVSVIYVGRTFTSPFFFFDVDK